VRVPLGGFSHGRVRRWLLTLIQVGNKSLMKRLVWREREGEREGIGESIEYDCAP